MSIKIKILVVINSIIVFAAAIFTIILYKTQKSALQDGIDSKLLASVHFAKMILPDDYHDRILDRKSVSPDAFKNIVHRNNKLCLKLNLQYLWSVMRINNKIVFTSATSTGKDIRNGDHAGFFDIHTNPGSFSSAFRTMKPHYSSFHNKWGHGRMVLLPDYDSKGRAYIFGASMSISDVDNMIRDTMINSLVIGLITILAGISISYILANTFSKPITKLNTAAMNIAGGDLDKEIVLKGSLELKSLSKSINIMRESIREKMNSLHDSEMRYRLLVETMREGLAVMDESGTITYTNPGVNIMTGFSAKELIGSNIFSFIIDIGQRNILRQIILQQKRVNKAYETEFRNKNKDKLILLVSPQSVYYHDGSFKENIVVLTDITEYRLAEENLIEAYKIINRSPIVVFLWQNKEGWPVDFVSENVESVFGYSVKEFITDRLEYAKLIHSDDLERMNNEVRNYSREKEKKIFEHIPYRIITKNGIIKWISHRTYIRRDKLGEITHYQGTVEDITDQISAQNEIQRLNAELEQRVKNRTTELEVANEELSKFAYAVSHDLKAPLRAINQLSSFIEYDLSEKLDTKTSEMMELMRGRVRRMNTLIDSILEYSRIGRLSEKIEEIDLNKLINDVIYLIAPPENIKIIIKELLPIIKGNSTHFGQIFQNLLSNAIVYNDKHEGEIQIGYTDNVDHWTFHVVDNGPGIEEKYHEKIFKIFQTLAPRDEHESTGIGLSLVKKIVEHYGGRIWIESKVGRECTFFFTIPKGELA